jgi:hypothetical protein
MRSQIARAPTDFGRNKRGRKHVKVSQDGLKLTWKTVGANEVVPDGSGSERRSSALGLVRSASFSRSTSSACAPRESARTGACGGCVASTRAPFARVCQSPFPT